MSDTLSEFMALLHANGVDARLSPWPVLTDALAPKFKRGDMALCRPVNRYVGEGYYVLHDGRMLYADSVGSGLIDLYYPAEKKHDRHSQKVTRQWFDDHVLGRAEYAINAFDGWQVPGVAEAADHAVKSWADASALPKPATGREVQL